MSERENECTEFGCRLKQAKARIAQLDEALNDQVERTLALDGELQVCRRRFEKLNKALDDAADDIIRLTDERDVFKRTLDKRDEELAVTGERLDHCVKQLWNIINASMMFLDVDPRMRYVVLDKSNLEGLRSWLLALKQEERNDD